MDEATEHKIRDLKLKILMTEKELTASQHKAGLGQWLQAGHAGQIAKASERDRKRLEDKLEDLKSKLRELTGETEEPAAVEASAPAEPHAAKKTAVKKTAVTKAASKKTAATKTAAAKKTAKKTIKK